MQMKRFLTVRRYRLSFLVLPVALLTIGYANRCASAEEPNAPAGWQGQYVGRMSLLERQQLATGLRSFFGQAKGALVPGVGRLLLDQFNAVGEPDEYRLPSGRLIVDQLDGRTRTDAIAVVTDSLDKASILATAFLIHLCTPKGVEESFTTSNGVKYKEHFPCELDYSLIILYARGSVPDSALDSDLTKWAVSSIEARVELVPDRQLVLNRFVRVLNGNTLNLDRADETLPLKVSSLLRSLELDH